MEGFRRVLHFCFETLERSGYAVKKEWSGAVPGEADYVERAHEFFVILSRESVFPAREKILRRPRASEFLRKREAWDADKRVNVDEETPFPVFTVHPIDKIVNFFFIFMRIAAGVFGRFSCNR